MRTSLSRPGTRSPFRILIAGLALWGALTGTGSANPIPADDLATHLAGLSAAEAGRRVEAERWLARNLQLADFPSVAEAVLGGGSEVRQRLTLALASDGRHLGLAALLLTDPRREVETVGEQAILGMLLAWSSTALDPPAQKGGWPSRLGTDPLGVLLDPGRGGLAEVVDRFDRRGQGPMPLVLDPSLDPEVAGPLMAHAPRPGSRLPKDQRPLTGSWLNLLTGTVHSYRVSREVCGWRGEGQAPSPGTHPFVLITKKGRRPRTAGEHILEWCRGVLRPHDSSWNAACARALATIDWAPALGWLEERWVGEDDRAALEGLLFAARRERVVPSLLRVPLLTSLLRRCDERLGSGDPGAARHAQELATALAVPALPAHARKMLAREMLDGWDALGGDSRWVRLVILEGQATPDPEVLERCRDLLAGSASPTLHWQALRTLGALGGTLEALPPQFPLEAALTHAEVGERLELWIRDLLAVGAQPPSSGEGFAGSLNRRLAYMQWWVGAHGEVGQGAEGLRILREMVAELGPPELALRVRPWQGRGMEPALSSFCYSGRQRLEPEDRELLGRFMLHAGLGTFAERKAALEHWETTKATSVEALEDLGALAADLPPLGPRARAAFLAAAQAGAAWEDLGAALEIAGRVLIRAGRQTEAHDLRDQVLGVFTLVGGDLPPDLYAAGWPRGVADPYRPLWVSDRHLDLPGR